MNERTEISAASMDSAECAEEQLVFDGLVERRRVHRESHEGVKLTERDLEIIEFALEMKFVDLESVYRKFFRMTRAGSATESRWLARKRISTLKTKGFLTASRFFSDSSSVYTATYKGYLSVRNSRPAAETVKHNTSVDIRTFDHDRKVLWARLALAESGEVVAWWSERKLKSDATLTGGLPKQHQPDAIYLTPGGERVAFELEIAQKARHRYQDKVRRYVQLMRAAKVDARPFSRVQFWCESKTVQGILEAETRIYGSLFEVRPLTALLTIRKGGQPC